jgi:hypothetical protein
MSLVIHKCEGISSLADSKGYLSFNIDKKDDNHDEITFKLDSKTTIFEEGYKKKVKEFFTGLKNLPNDGDDEISKNFKIYLSKNEDRLFEMVPKLYSLSPMGTNIDMEASLKKNHEDIENFELKIKDFNFTTTPYSFLMNGQVKFEMFSGDAEIKIVISHYKQMIQDLVKFINYYDEIMTKLESPEEGNEDLITSKNKDDFINVLKKASDKPKTNEDDLHLTIHASSTGEVKIGNMDINQFVEDLDKIFEKPEEKKTPEPDKK